MSSAREGWRVVAALFVMLTLGSGFGFYNLSVYMTALAAERDFAIAELSLAISLFFLTGGFCGLVVARMLERFDVRLIMTVGAVISGLALLLAGLARSETQLLAVYVLFGLGNSGVSLVPMTTVVTRWFPGTNRSMALATASTGLSLGGVIITPICVALIESNGIEISLQQFGVFYALLLMPIIWGFIRLPAPSNHEPGTANPLLAGWSEQQARRSRFFVLFTAAYFLLMRSNPCAVEYYGTIDWWLAIEPGANTLVVGGQCRRSGDRPGCDRNGHDRCRCLDWGVAVWSYNWKPADAAAIGDC